MNRIPIFAALLLAAGPTTARADDFQRVQYNHPGLAVDLGVGLWAWPLPIDWDGDGDLDLVVSCPDVPFNGTYFFENPGGGKMPVFRPPVRIGAALRNVRLSHHHGRPVVLTPGTEWIDFLGKGFTSKRTIECPNPHTQTGRVRADQWHYVDYDADGDRDLIVGGGWWGDYGWDNAFDRRGRWTRGPLHGYVYLMRNTGTDAEPEYASPAKVRAGDEDIDVYGMPSPCFADFDSDGDLDIVCGEFLDGFTYFKNGGSKEKPKYEAGRRLRHEGQALAMHVQMITPTAIDWDGDGDIDLVVGDEDGRVALVEHTGAVDENGTPRFLPPIYFQQEARDLKFGALVTPVSVDWDSDGDEDLICGNTSGNIAFIENLDGGTPPRWAAPHLLEAGEKTIRIQAGENGSIQGPCEVKWGYTTQDVADWDGDGLLDIVANSIWGKVVWFRNVGSATAAKLAPAEPVRVHWETAPPKPAWNWWRPEAHELATQWRTTPLVHDWDRDGLADLIMLDHEGYLALFPRIRRGSEQVLTPGRRVFRKRDGSPWKLSRGDAGKSGRRKLALADWDADGDLDLLINSSNIDVMVNEGSKDGVTTLASPIPLASQKLAGHTTSPTTVDWDGDGERQLLAGAEDGRFYLLTTRPPVPKTVRTDAFTIRGTGFEIGELTDGGTAYSNRSYVWFGVPTELQGLRYTKTAGGERASIWITAHAAADVRVCISGESKLLNGGNWQRDAGLKFGYSDKGKTAMAVYSRQLGAGEEVEVPQGSWTGTLVLFSPLPSKNLDSEP